MVRSFVEKPSLNVAAFMYGSIVNGGLMSHVRRPSLRVSVRSTNRAGTTVMLGEDLRPEDREQVRDGARELAAWILSGVVAAELEATHVRDGRERRDGLAEQRERDTARGGEHDRTDLGGVDDLSLIHI